MTHYLPYAPDINTFNQIVNSFDVNAYANDVAQTGATYVIFTLGQAGYFCSPNSTLNGLCGTVTSNRDLVSEVSDALAARGIKLIAYMPSGAPQIMAAGTQYQTSGRNADFQNHWQAAIAEYSNRWGDKVAGWWFDGCYTWQDMYAFTAAPNFQTFGAAAKAGNPGAIVAFNDGSGPYSNHSQYGDWAAGEIHDPNQSLGECEGRWVKGTDPATGNAFQLQWNLHTFLGHNFLGNGYGGPNDTPRFSNSYLINYIKRVIANGGTCEFDVPMHMGGGTDPNPSLAGHLGANFMPQLQAIGQALASGVPAPGPGNNAALNRPTSAANSFSSGTGPALANDGNMGTIWASGTDTSSVKWWQTDLGSRQTINAVQVVFSQSDNRDFLREEFQIQASDDPNFGSYDLIGFETDSFYLLPFTDFFVYPTSTVTHRYVRVTRPPSDSYWGPSHFQIAEARIFTGSSGASVPAAPTGLSATAGNAQVTLSWSASSGATSYNLYRNGTNVRAGITGTSVTDAGLTNGTTYSYQVSGTNAAGEGSRSSTVSATPVGGPTLPVAPTGLSASAGNAQISLTWNAVSGATSYNLYRNGTRVKTGLTGTSVTDTGLANGTSYAYQVSATNAAGEGAKSATVNATPIANTGPITLSGSVTGGTVQLSWTSTVPNVAYYTVYRGTTAGGEGTTPLDYPSATSWTDNFSPVHGTSYYYVVRAVDIYGNTSSASNEVKITP